MKKMFFNKAVFKAKTKFINENCLEVLRCKDCPLWDSQSKKCTHKDYVNASLLTDETYHEQLMKKGEQ